MDLWKISQTVDLKRSGGNPPVEAGIVCQTGDNAAHTWSVHVLSDGSPANLEGLVVTGYFLRKDGVTVQVAGSVEGSLANVVFAGACLAIPGEVVALMRLTDGTSVMTIGVLYITVAPGPGSNIIIA